jgi:hypothetical protein
MSLPLDDPFAGSALPPEDKYDIPTFLRRKTSWS